VEFTQIRAPIGGRISRKLIAEGNYITGGSGSGTLLTTIVSIDPIYFYFDISEADYLKYKRLLEEGKRPSSREAPNPIEVGLQGDASFPLKGQMNFVDNRIDQNTGSLRERATFQNANGNLVPGLFARARVIGSGEYQAILLPDAAIAADQSNRFVFVVAEDGTVDAKAVTLGPIIDGMRVVRTGVTPSDWVIVNGVQRARKGIKVKADKISIEQDRKAASLQ
jgi:RND family efflux transporter MFP subunit